jgi:hypothetical protein
MPITVALGDAGAGPPPAVAVLGRAAREVSAGARA